MDRSLIGLYILFTLFIFSCTSAIKKDNKAAISIDSLKNTTNPYVKIDQSPLDISWCPENYPIEKMKGNDSLKLIAKLIYSRPHKKGRSLFGEAKENLCAYDVPWRLGANEATEIQFFENVNIAGKNILKGTYVLYCIPHADRWTIIFNSNLNTWGLHINNSKDIFKFDIPVMKQEPQIEDFTMFFQDIKTGANLVMAWDNVKTVLPIIFLIGR